MMVEDSGNVVFGWIILGGEGGSRRKKRGINEE